MCKKFLVKCVALDVEYVFLCVPNPTRVQSARDSQTHFDQHIRVRQTAHRVRRRYSVSIGCTRSYGECDGVRGRV